MSLPAVFLPALLGFGWLDPQTLLHQLGAYALWGGALMIFAECGLLVGFFLPGDSLLFTVGLLIGRGYIGYPLWLSCLVLSVAAVAGNACGYLIGATAGPAVFDRRRSRWLRREYVTRTHEFFERFGNRAIVLGRFVPVVRTLITVMAGVGAMGFRRFVTYSAIGGVIWASGVMVLGYFLGEIAFLRSHIEAMLGAMVLVSLLPVGLELFRSRLFRRKGGR